MKPIEEYLEELLGPPSAQERLRVAAGRCPRCAGQAQEFEAGVHHCLTPACGAFWSMA